MNNISTESPIKLRDIATQGTAGVFIGSAVLIFVTKFILPHDLSNTLELFLSGIIAISTVGAYTACFLVWLLFATKQSSIKSFKLPKGSTMNGIKARLINYFAASANAVKARIISACQPSIDIE